MLLSEQAKATVDTISVMTVAAAVAAWLPPIAALASLVWTVIRIWETKTVQNYLRRRKQKCHICGGDVKDTFQGTL